MLMIDRATLSLPSRDRSTKAIASAAGTQIIMPPPTGIASPVRSVAASDNSQAAASPISQG